MRIKRSGIRISSQFKKFGPWKVDFFDEFDDNYAELSERDQKKVDMMIKQLKIKPYQGTFGQHPLWEFYDQDNECVIWSAEINPKDRLNYLIFKKDNTIKIINLLGHSVLGMNYGNLSPEVIRKPIIGRDGRIITPKHK